MKLFSTQHTSHIIVDFQNDFVAKKGTLSVDAEALGGTIKSLIILFAAKGMENIATKDWHPVGHRSFASTRGEEPTYTDESRPDHCLAGTRGSQLHWTIDNLPDLIIHKGTHKDKEAYSGFQDTLLGDRLHNNNIKTVIITGVATDYCVEATALDALKQGLRTIIISDAIKAVDEQQGQQKIEELKTAGVEFVTAQDIMNILQA